MSESDALLLTPGPTQVPRSVIERMAAPVMHHRSQEFRALWRRINSGLETVFGTTSPVLTLASSGTGAMEASIVNLLSRNDTVLSFSAGKWGERYEEIARAYGLNVKAHHYEYGSSVGPDDVLRALEADPSAKAVLIALCETSTGALHPVEEIAAITRSSNALLFVDAISGLGCDEFRLDDWGVDVAVSASQKGLMVPPGLGFVALGRRAAAALQVSDLPKYYFDLKTAIAAHGRHDSAFTPAITLLYGLDEALRLMVEEGMQTVWERHEQVGDYVRRKLEAAGFARVASVPSNALTAVRPQSGIDADSLRSAVKGSANIIFAGGQGPLKGNILRFAHMGDTARLEHADRGLEALRHACSEYKLTSTTGHP